MIEVEVVGKVRDWRSGRAASTAMSWRVGMVQTYMELMGADINISLFIDAGISVGERWLWQRSKSAKGWKDVGCEK